jgi:mRNA interferase MazF
MTRGEIVTVVLPGECGKPRPAVVVRHDAFEALPSVTLLPLTSDVRDLPLLRVSVPAGRESGLRLESQLQVDKIMTVPRSRVGRRVGTLDEEVMRAVDEALKGFLGLA